MNLYKILFVHYAPKDREEGIKTYLIAENDSEVYEWLRSSPDGIYTSYEGNELEEEEDEKGEYRKRILESQGCMFDDWSELPDLYYGATQYGWELAIENISEDKTEWLIENKIAIKK